MELKKHFEVHCDGMSNISVVFQIEQTISGTANFKCGICRNSNESVVVKYKDNKKDYECPEFIFLFTEWVEITFKQSFHFSFKQLKLKFIKTI